MLILSGNIKQKLFNHLYTLTRSNCFGDSGGIRNFEHFLVCAQPAGPILQSLYLG